MDSSLPHNAGASELASVSGGVAVGNLSLLLAWVSFTVTMIWAKMIGNTCDPERQRVLTVEAMHTLSVSDTYYRSQTQSSLDCWTRFTTQPPKLKCNHTGSRLTSTDLSTGPNQPATAHRNKVPLIATYELEGLDPDFCWRSKPTHQIAHSEHTHFGCPQCLKLRISKTGLHIPTSFPWMSLLWFQLLQSTVMDPEKERTRKRCVCVCGNYSQIVFRLFSSSKA